MTALLAFDCDRRYLLCDHCGGSVEVQRSASTATCGYCRSPLQVRMRPEAAAEHRARSEAERLDLLASSDRRFIPPHDIAHLFAGERVSPSFEQEARARWQQLRHSLQTGGDVAGVDSFFLLTLGLAELSFDRGDFVTQRAFVDTALGAPLAPHHVQVLRAQLARTALTAGDPQAAEAWVALCDPRSESLLADTAYRFARSYLDTAKGDHAAVIRTLGAGSDVPLSDAYAPECAVLCANAWEGLAQRTTAVDALLAIKRELGPIGRRRIARFIAAHPSWHLCQTSEPEAERRAEFMDRTPPEGGELGWRLLLAMGIYSLVWAISAAVLPIGLHAAGYEVGSGFLLSGFGAGVLAAIFLPIALFARVRAGSRREMHFGGVPCTAHILHLRRLGDHPGLDSTAIEIDVLLVPDDAAAYTVRKEFGVQKVMVSNFVAGKIHVARVSRRDPRDFRLEIR